MALSSDASQPLTAMLSSCWGNSQHGSQILVQDSLQLSGTFLVCGVLKCALQAKHRIVLVPAEQSLERYRYILRKMGVQLQPALDSGQLVVQAPLLASAGRAPANLEKDTTHQPAVSTPLKQLVQQLHTALEAQASRLHSSPDSQQEAVILVIDSLSSLHLLATSQAEWLSFTHYASSLGASLPVPVNRVMCVHSDVEEDLPWITRLAHTSHMILQVLPLEGRIADIDGQVVMQRRRATHHVSGLAHGQVAVKQREAIQQNQRLYFRGMETGVRWFEQMSDRDLLWQ